MIPGLDLYSVADALQNARDRIMQARGSINRNREIDLAIENIRDAMKLLGMKEAETNGN
jgi:uncharacterized membrane protein